MKFRIENNDRDMLAVWMRAQSTKKRPSIFASTQDKARICDFFEPEGPTKKPSQLRKVQTAITGTERKGTTSSQLRSPAELLFRNEPHFVQDIW